MMIDLLIRLSIAHFQFIRSNLAEQKKKKKKTKHHAANERLLKVTQVLYLLSQIILSLRTEHALCTLFAYKNTVTHIADGPQ